ncbi:aspartate kinase [Flavobacterium granuli]|uniref:homoserine dehydrogenase n=1 Tax=Flavobacterium granuli TaxID=280093 RepID=A0ABU1S6S6_9FLAO|nr:aspartate kinase [Flavobacterium granuli]MDR6846731.1 homoserine dehydrogenase [Flavobacterium granuli]
MSVLRINVILFGIGNIGSALINQVLESQQFFREKRNIDLRFPIITNSTLAFFEKEGVKNAWEANFDQLAIPFTIEGIIEFAQNKGLENVIAVDATASSELVKHYIPLIQNGFNIVAVNQNANVLHIDFYKEIRRNLKKFDKTFLYETNIEAGIPVLKLISDLYYSGEKITKIRGVFSDSLSYVFNRFSSEDVPFSKILNDAEKRGLLKKDFRDELSGVEVAKKLLVLARELGKNTEFLDIKISSLFYDDLEGTNLKSKFYFDADILDKYLEIAKITQVKNEVLRYVGEISIADEKLEVKLISEPITSAIGQLKGSETVFEIYTESHGNVPIIVHGDSSRKKTTTIARGILTDILKVAEKIKIKETVWL